MDESSIKYYKKRSVWSPLIIRRRLSVPETVMRKYFLAQQKEESEKLSYGNPLLINSRSHWNRSEDELSIKSEFKLPTWRSGKYSDYMRKSVLLKRFWRTDRFNETARQLIEYHQNKMLFEKSINPPSHHSSAENSYNPNNNNNNNVLSLHSSPNNKSDLSESNTTLSVSTTIKTTTSETESDRISTRSTETSHRSYSDISEKELTASENDIGTNLNVISNIQLSQSTLNLIFNQVMEDVSKQNIILDEVRPEIFNVKKIPSFYLQRQEIDNALDLEKQNRIHKYMISNLNLSNASPAVATYPIHLRHTSIEVNTSSEESTDKNSDTTSLVDSLEDPTSPRICKNASNVNKHDFKPVRGDLYALMSTDTHNKKHANYLLKNEAYFIPLLKDPEENKKLKTVAEMLPKTLRNKLSKRQMERELKMKLTKNKTKEQSIHSNNEATGKDIPEHLTDGTAHEQCEHNAQRNRLLPNIKSFTSFKIDGRGNANLIETKPEKRKQSKKKSSSKFPELKATKTKMKLDANNKTLKSTKHFHKTNSVLSETSYKRPEEHRHLNKRIEILEIMECVEPTSVKYKTRDYQKSPNKSKIPVPIQPKLPKPLTPKTPDILIKPFFLCGEEKRNCDPKLDQLIANILIDALNKPDTQDSLGILPNEEKKCMAKFSVSENHSFVYLGREKPEVVRRHLFESIPEEKQNSHGDTDDNDQMQNENGSDRCMPQTKTEKNIQNMDIIHLKQPCYKGKEALAGVQEENFIAIPKGWITFYLLKKSDESQDASADEGTKSAENEKQRILKKVEHNITVQENKPAVAKTVKKQNITPVQQRRNREPVDSSDSDQSSTNEEEIVDEVQCSERHRTHHGCKREYIPLHYPKNEWSVTMTGSHIGHFIPEMKMHIKLPQSNQTSNHPDAGLDNYASSTNNHLPNIVNNNINHADKSKRYHPSALVSRSKIEPRQTQTSFRRYSLHHSTHPHFKEQREISDSFQKFPQILTIRGNTIYSENNNRIVKTKRREYN